MQSTRTALLVTLLVMGLATGAQAKDKWQKITDLTAGGGAKEVVVNRQVSMIRLRIQSGNVIINTVVVREGGKKTPHTIGASFQAKTSKDITLPAGKTNVTGLRISDGGQGTYTVYVK